MLYYYFRALHPNYFLPFLLVFLRDFLGVPVLADTRANRPPGMPGPKGTPLPVLLKEPALLKGPALRAMERTDAARGLDRCVVGYLDGSVVGYLDGIERILDGSELAKLEGGVGERRDIER